MITGNIFIQNDIKKEFITVILKYEKNLKYQLFKRIKGKEV